MEKNKTPKRTKKEDAEVKTKHTEIKAKHTELKTIRVFVEGRDYKTTHTKKFEERKLWAPPNPEELKSFLPGAIEKIHVKQGDEVKRGDVLMTFVAMKMHNLVRAPFDGKVSALHVKVGDKVPKGTVMIAVSKAKASKEEKPSKPSKPVRRIRRIRKQIEKRQAKAK